MNWSKAKTILIIALLFTNILLIYTYGFHGKEEGEMQDKATLVEVLASQNIYLNVDIPEKHESMPILSIQYAETDRELVEREMREVEPVDVNVGKASYIKTAESFLQNCGYMTDTVELSEVQIEPNAETDNRKIVRFRNIYNDIAVEESYMVCTFEDGVLVDFDRYWLEPVSLSKKKIRTISAAAAMISFMSEATEDEPTVIEDIELVYWLKDAGFNAYTAVSDMAFPAWRVTYNGGQVRHIDAAQL